MAQPCFKRVTSRWKTVYWNPKAWIYLFIIIIIIIIIVVVVVALILFPKYRL